MPHELTKAARIEFWFDFGSNYSYPAVMRIDELIADSEVSVVWRPFLLGPIFRSFGWETSPFVLQKEKGGYVWRDMERQCTKYRLPWKRPSNFPRRAILPMRVAILGSNEPWISAYNKQIMHMNFAEDRDVEAPELVGEVLQGLGLPASEILRAAQTDENKLRLREQTETARTRGVFGAPTFFVGEEMFWGNDRLEDALDFASKQSELDEPGPKD